LEKYTVLKVTLGISKQKKTKNTLSEMRIGNVIYNDDFLTLSDRSRIPDLCCPSFLCIF